MVPWLLMTMTPFGKASTIDRTFLSCSVTRITAWFTIEAIATSSIASATKVSKEAAPKFSATNGGAADRNTYQPRTPDNPTHAAPVQKPPSSAPMMIIG
jgi:hypothetical protein